MFVKVPSHVAALALPLAEGLDVSSEAGRERVRLAIEHFGIGFFETDLPTGKVTMTPNAFGMFGLSTPSPPIVDRDVFWSCYHPADAAWARERFAADLRGERGHDDYCERVRIVRRNDGAVRWIEFNARMFGPPGARTHVVGMLRDVTDEVEAADRQHLLMREIDHRANNSLAVVQALVRITDGPDVSAFRRSLEGRILALGRSLSLIATPQLRGLTASDVVAGELAAFSDRISLDLTALPPLAQFAVQPLCMILHELATNAAKHGALSVASGRVRVTGEVLAGEVVLRWDETGGPPADGPLARRGTGMTVVQAQARRLSGTMAYHWRREGLAVELRVPRERWI